MRPIIILLGLLALVGCESRTYQTSGPCSTIGVDGRPVCGDSSVRVIVIRTYLGAKPAWYQPGYLPEPDVHRGADGVLIVHDYVYADPVSR